ncbi:MAG: hypothetical protein F6K41_10840 [Symploca sp. SIO3E6]|nr:hypothetical protein [Caldora sp. SIO3E6]
MIIFILISIQLSAFSYQLFGWLLIYSSSCIHEVHLQFPIPNSQFPILNSPFLILNS